jgi:hypothetical protein
VSPFLAVFAKEKKVKIILLCLAVSMIVFSFWIKPARFLLSPVTFRILMLSPNISISYLNFLTLIDFAMYNKNYVPRKAKTINNLGRRK